jgi:hypothetical protein
MPLKTHKRRGGKNNSDSERSSSSKNKTEKKKPQPKMSKEDEKLIESEVVYFDSKSKGDIKVLSNFYKCDIKVDNTMYPSGEHAYHGQKYKQIAAETTNITGNKRKNELEDYADKFTSSGEFKDLFDGKIKTKELSSKETPQELFAEEEEKEEDYAKDSAKDYAKENKNTQDQFNQLINLYVYE